MRYIYICGIYICVCVCAKGLTEFLRIESDIAQTMTWYLLINQRL